ncbi:MAG TPA: GAF domain-containing protein [Pararhizobium sp.]|uniref:GAF domain-containing protein n=1 Tax=Pararhizobium sp. TaxID=1977563 RepID=UPI002BC05705|nr:GAF domain-containing protein [Pararhizobium sp.]HTO34000.1 GAF domain-containing protein [Pararhizobium sp.]
MPSLLDATDIDHQKRLEALEAYDILDTPPEPEFDDIVLVASIACKTPSALVSLVEIGRQWFKARVGFEAGETQIGQSICANAMGSPDVLVIPDLTQDPRTSTNPLVVGKPHIRFYAGAPLITPDGTIIGTLCVIDTMARPQGLDEPQRKALEALARQVILLLEARRVSRRKDELFKRQKSIASSIRTSASKTLAAQEAGRIGTFEVDIATSSVKGSAEFCRIFSMAPADSYPASVFEDMVLPEDRGLQSHDASRNDGNAEPDVEYRISTADRGVRWIARHATFEHDAIGRPVRMLGTVQDITAQKRSIARTEALLALGDRLRDLDDIESMALVASDLMAKALDASRAGFGIVDSASETMLMQPEWRAPGIASLAGVHPLRSYGTFIDDLKQGLPVVITDVTTDPRTADDAEALLAIGIRVLVNLPIFDHGKFSLIVFVHHDRPYEWSEEELSFIRSFGNRIQSALARLQAEADQNLLNNEIGHRLKNTFAMVQAIASQTLRPVTERDHVLNFEKRLQALSTAHDALLVQNWTGADVATLVASSLETLGMSDRFDVSGPAFTFGPRSSLSLSLLLHELATNAVKYGSLSSPAGRVSINWSINGTGDQATFHFEWKEDGGPPASPPKSKGFGSRLINMGLTGTGDVTASYDPSGFMVEMTAVLSQLQQAK